MFFSAALRVCTGGPLEDLRRKSRLNLFSFPWLRYLRKMYWAISKGEIPLKKQKQKSSTVNGPRLFCFHEKALTSSVGAVFLFQILIYFFYVTINRYCRIAKCGKIHAIQRTHEKRYAG